MKRPTLQLLTGLRFFLALGIVFYHQTTAGGGLHEYFSPQPVPYLFTQLFIGVPAFFILSGFILFYNYEKPRDLPRFFLARVARILPLYLVGMILSLPVLLLSAHKGFISYSDIYQQGWINLLFLQTWLLKGDTVWNGPSWSLSVEAFFYITFPIIAFMITRTKRTIYYLFPTFLLVMIIASNNFSIVLPVLHLPQFILGVVIAKIFMDYSSTNSRQIIILSIISLSTISYFLFSTTAFLISLLPVIILGLAWANWSVSPIWILLGESSYALYILHIPLTYYIKNVIPFRHSSPMLYLLTYVFILVTISILAFKYIETPARRFITRLGKPKVV